MDSYSKQVKDRLLNIDSLGIYEAIAQLLGITLFSASVDFDKIKLSCESRATALCFRKLLFRILGFDTEILRDNVYYTVLIDNVKTIKEMLILLRLIDNEDDRLIKMRISSSLIETDSCKSAFLRGAFLGGGTIVDPIKNYSVEFVTHYLRLSKEFLSVLEDMGLSCSSTVRNSKYVIYSKNSEKIVDMLVAMGDEYSAEELIKIKEERELRNELNRSVNSETANIDKVISASIRHLQAIEIIEKSIGLENISPELRDMAYARLEYRDLSLEELGRKLTPPLSKSGVNHRMRKIMKLAEEI